MPVITIQKNFNEIYDRLVTHGELSTVVISCEENAKGCYTEGSKAVQRLREKIQKSNLMLLKPKGMLDALKKRLMR